MSQRILEFEDHGIRFRAVLTEHEHGQRIVEFFERDDNGGTFGVIDVFLADFISRHSGKLLALSGEQGMYIGRTSMSLIADWVVRAL